MPISSHHDDPAELLRWLARRLSLQVHIDMGIRVAHSQAPGAVDRTLHIKPARPWFSLEAGRPVFDDGTENATEQDFAFACGLASFLEHN